MKTFKQLQVGEEVFLFNKDTMKILSVKVHSIKLGQNISQFQHFIIGIKLPHLSSLIEFDCISDRRSSSSCLVKDVDDLSIHTTIQVANERYAEKSNLAAKVLAGKIRNQIKELRRFAPIEMIEEVKQSILNAFGHEDRN